MDITPTILPDPAATQNWTYSGNPAHSPKDQLRFLIGDTDKRVPLFSDGELEWLLTTSGQSTGAAALSCIDTLILRYSRLADETVGQVSISYSQMYKGLLETRGILLQRFGYTTVTPYAGGISATDKWAQSSDGDTTQPYFARGMLETPGLNAGEPGSTVTDWATDTTSE